MNLFPEAAKVGTGLGAGLGGILGALGGVLSAPRRALWSMFGDTESGNEAISNWTGEDKDSVLAHVLGFGLEALTDPLTWAGGLLGRVGGNAAGKGLSSAAVRAGPGYAADAGKLASGGTEYGSALKRFLAEAPEAEIAAAAREIPEGSRFLSAGREAAAYETPAGNVVRVQHGLESDPGRVIAPEMLQPTRSARHGKTTIEHLPAVASYDRDRAALDKAYPKLTKQADENAFYKGLWGSGEKWDKAAIDLKNSSIDRGLNPVDLIRNNIGQTAEGKLLTFDSGAILDPTGKFPMVEPTSLGDSGIASYLAHLLGGQRRLRGVLEKPFSTMGQGV